MEIQAGCGTEAHKFSAINLEWLNPSHFSALVQESYFQNPHLIPKIENNLEGGGGDEAGCLLFLSCGICQTSPCALAFGASLKSGLAIK